MVANSAPCCSLDLKIAATQMCSRGMVRAQVMSSSWHRHTSDQKKTHASAGTLGPWGRLVLDSLPLNHQENFLILRVPPNDLARTAGLGGSLMNSKS